MSLLSKAAVTKMLLAVLTCLVVSGCADYSFTVNDNVLYTPDTLFSGYDIVDPGLRACVKQLVNDGSITAASQLEEINCSHAGVADLQGIEIFSGLTRLKLSSNAISNLAPLADLYRLSELYLDGNQITSLSAVRQLPDLSYVDVSGNAQLNCTELANMAKTPSLKLVLPEHCQGK
jgi:Leucine-rich repeat (LRR) protein